MALATFNSSSNGDYFRPANYAVGTAFAIEVLHFQRQAPSPNGPKDTATVDIHEFDDGGNYVTTMEGVKINQTILAADLEQYAGQTVPVTLQQGNAKPGKQAPWVWRGVDDAGVMEGIEEYVNSLDEVEGPPEV